MMNFPDQVGLKPFEADRTVAEGIRQTAHSVALTAGGGNAVVAGAFKAADIAFYRTLIASAQTNGVQAGGFTAALRELGG